VSHDVSEVVGSEGWINWQALTARINRKTVADWTKAGKLVRLQSGLYATSSSAMDWRVRVEAAVRSRRGVASHATALALWGLVPQTTGPVHVLVEQGRSVRGSAGVVLHRGGELWDAVRRVDGLAVTCVERAIVDCWGRPSDLGRPAVRAAAITAVRKRMCRPADLAYELSRRPQLPGRAALAELIQLLADGCQSELEIWGVRHVLRGPGMPTFVQQLRVTVRGKTFFVDAACEEVLLAVELDGSAWHGSREQRERDISRDALMATIGWQTLRFGYWPMTTRPDACRADIRAAYEARIRLMYPDRVR
jgi:very-short-patch-repair endonuclease/predicted transcriptional regulator of viral defense system